MDQDLIFQLLKQIHMYYPVGMPHLNNRYPGYKKLLLILEEKINNIIDKKEGAWQAFITSINSGGKLSIKDEAYYQFPSYQLSLETLHESSADMTRQRSICLVLSLLTNHYTIYLKQSIVLTQKNPSPFYQLSTTYTPAETDIVNLLKNEISNHFKDYHFIHHKLLFDHKVEGALPHGEALGEKRNVYPIYNYLFGLSNGETNAQIQD